MKIIFWGTPRYASENLISIVDAGYEVIAVVTQPDKRRSRGKKLLPSPVKQAALDLEEDIINKKVNLLAAELSIYDTLELQEKNSERIKEIVGEITASGGRSNFFVQGSRVCDALLGLPALWGG